MIKTTWNSNFTIKAIVNNPSKITVLLFFIDRLSLNLESVFLTLDSIITNTLTVKTLAPITGLSLWIASSLFVGARAQSPIVALTSTYVSTSNNVGPYSTTPAPNSGSYTGCASTLYNYSYNNGTNNALRLLSITANSKNFFVTTNASAIIKLRRVDNTNVTGSRTIVFLETTTAPATACGASSNISFKSPYQDVMENFLNNRFINQGTDNIFTNASNSDGNNNNIERVDVIFPAGVSSASTTDAGFALFDRGNNLAHDPFKIAAITSLDRNGNPASFGAVKTCIGGNGADNGSWGHPTFANGNVDLSVYVSRKEATETRIRVSAAINQQIGGVFFSFQDLGVATNQVIYGYALLGPDGIANPSSAQMLNINNSSVYPTNTTEAVGGGLDLIAVNALFTTSSLLPVEPIHLEGEAVSGEDILKWTITDAYIGAQLELQRSENGSSFTSVYSIANLDEAAGQYAYMSENNNRLYRLKIRLSTGETFYSTVIRLQGGAAGRYRVYPTIIHSSDIIRTEGFRDGRYKVIVSSLDGRSGAFALTIQGGTGTIAAPAAGYQSGVYVIQMMDQFGTVYPATKIIVQ